MELRHLRYFVAVAELLHFGRAAARLQIAQPSLSHQVRQLEAELETALLSRTKRRVQLTEAGRLFLKEAREILAQADRAAVIARRASRGEVGTLRVGLVPWVDWTHVVAAVETLNGRHPAIQFDLRTMSVPAQIAALRDDGLDVGFVRPPVGEPSIASEILTNEPFVVALPGNHRLAARETVPVAALADEPFALMPRHALPTFYDLVLMACRDAGFVPHVGHEVDHPDLVLRFVAAGLGVSLVPASARRARLRGVVFRPLARPPRMLQTAVAWRSGDGSPLVSGFVRIVREITAGARRRRPA